MLVLGVEHRLQSSPPSKYAQCEKQEERKDAKSGSIAIKIHGHDGEGKCDLLHSNRLTQRVNTLHPYLHVGCVTMIAVIKDLLSYHYCYLQIGRNDRNRVNFLHCNSGTVDNDRRVFRKYLERLRGAGNAMHQEAVYYHTLQDTNIRETKVSSCKSCIKAIYKDANNFTETSRLPRVARLSS